MQWLLMCHRRYWSGSPSSCLVGVPFGLQLPNRLETLFMFSQALNVVFEKIPENDSADVCRNISVNVLDCDTIGQAKEKIFQAFLSKNGSPYGLQLNEICLGKATRELFCPRPLMSTPVPPSLPAPSMEASICDAYLACCSRRALLGAPRLRCSPTAS